MEALHCVLRRNTSSYRLLRLKIDLNIGLHTKLDHNFTIWLYNLNMDGQNSEDGAAEKKKSCTPPGFLFVQPKQRKKEYYSQEVIVVEYVH